VAPLIEAINVSKRFAGGLGREATLALAPLSLAIDSETPSIIAVVGESGSGKTTLARLLLGLAEPTGGAVRYHGRDLRKLTREDRRAFRHDVQAVFQDPYGVFNPFYRVDHVLWTPVQRFGLAASRSEGRELIGEALRSVGLRPEEILGRFPHQLSGGQRQRVMVARALLLKPKLIVADEPVSMVDASLRATILGSLRKLTDERGISILYITHDLATAYQVSDSVLVLYRAHLVEAGATEHVIGAPQHPYTQLLISAIPRAHVKRDWLAKEDDVKKGDATLSAGGCCFADRCPHAASACLAAPPALYRTDPHRAVACVQFQSRAVLPSGALTEVLQPVPAVQDASWQERFQRDRQAG
jgi:oligopeptide/dipeptide ABC transporter ATP-binding protein